MIWQINVGVPELKTIWKKRNNAFRIQIHLFGLKFACNITSHKKTKQNPNRSVVVSFYFIVISLTGHAPFLGGVVDGALSYRLLYKGDKVGID